MEIFNNLCRSCNIKKNKLVNIHDIMDSTTSIKHMLEYCLHKTITNESKYPKFMCYDCLKQLEISYRFIKRFHLSQSEFEESFTYLQKIFEKDNNDCITESDIGETYYDRDLKNIDETKNISLDISLPQNEEKLLRQIHGSKRFPVIDESSQSHVSPSTTCSFCKKTFYTNKALNLHMKLSHKQKLPYL